MLYFNANAGALFKYFGAPSATSQDEELSTSAATHMSPQMLSDPEDEDPITSTSPQQDSSGEFVCTCQ